MKNKEFDVIIIGAGLSGIAAGIRLAMFDKKVCILERHYVPGGLNSYYRRGKRLLDVGLHAMTNFAERGSRGKPLTKLLKQLRIPYSDLELAPQKFSKVVFPGQELHFSNDIELLKSDISNRFPKDVDGFIKLIEMINDFNETALENEYQSAKQIVAKYIKNDELRDMIFFPLLIYGSAWENDMDFSQFAIMFKSIFLEGFSRPVGAVRTILDLLVEKFSLLGGVIEYKTQVEHIVAYDGKACGVQLENGEVLSASSIISSIGNPETMNLLENRPKEFKSRAGLMSFTETIMTMDARPVELGEEAAIVFLNKQERYDYSCPCKLYNDQSAVICFSNNFEVDDFDEGIVRMTNIANYDLWKKLEKQEYLNAKDRVLKDGREMLRHYNDKLSINPTFTDVFTPLTVEKYTTRIKGAVYGSPDKLRTGETHIDGLFVCGTDQGFLGIVGAMLSGISMANLHVLSKS